MLSTMNVASSPSVKPASTARAANSAPVITTSTARAMKRDPSPASGSASSIPSGAAIVRVSSYCIATVNLERFEAERSSRWEALEAALKRAGDRPERLGADGVRELGGLYRATAADLALARRRFPGDPRTRWLEALVL